MSRELRWLAAGVLLGILCGCATKPATEPPGAYERPPRVATSVEVARTAQSLRGRSSGEVTALLGPATRIRFDSGYEVWLYRFVEPPSRAPDREPGDARARQAQPPSELVMLVTPSGIVDKVRATFSRRHDASRPAGFAE